MKLYLIRHADAVTHGEGVRKDGERFLSRRGRSEMRRVAARLADLLDPGFDGMLTSPLLRAVQTAEIVAGATGFEGEVETCPALESGCWTPASLSKVLGGRMPGGSYAMVGHNPDMERIASGLLRAKGTTVPFQKGTVCLIELEGEPFGDPARFRWVLQPDDLKVVHNLLDIKG